jgi:hypothetical protein
MLGVGIGILLRFFGEYFLFKTVFLTQALHEIVTGNYQFFINITEFWILIFVLISASLLFFFVLRGQTWIRSEYEGIHDVLIKKSPIMRGELTQIFTEKGYFAEEKN